MTLVKLFDRMMIQTDFFYTDGIGKVIGTLKCLWST